MLDAKVWPIRTRTDKQKNAKEREIIALFKSQMFKHFRAPWGSGKSILSIQLKRILFVLVFVNWKITEIKLDLIFFYLFVA